MPSHEVRKASAGEIEAIGRTLGLAFQDDPVFRWVISDPGRRAATLGPGFELFLRKLWLEMEESYVCDDAEGAAIWHPPGRGTLGIVEQLRLFPGFTKVWGRTTVRALRGLAALEAGHPEEPHYYLAVLGVAPEKQGRGLGSKLMFPVLSRCDSDGVGAYLEASSERNRALYERHGFVTTGEERIGRGAPPVWRMWRQPGAGGSPSSGPIS